MLPSEVGQDHKDCYWDILRWQSKDLSMYVLAKNMSMQDDVPFDPDCCPLFQVTMNDAFVFASVVCPIRSSLFNGPESY